MHTDTRQFLAQRPARSERPAHRSCCYDSAVIGTTPALRELASSSRGCPTFLHEASILVVEEGSQENTAVGRAAGEEEEGIWEPADEVFRDRLLTLAVAEAFFFICLQRTPVPRPKASTTYFKACLLRFQGFRVPEQSSCQLRIPLLRPGVQPAAGHWPGHRCPPGNLRGKRGQGHLCPWGLWPACLFSTSLSTFL